ncbi:MAG: zinc-dependent metalloprotease [Betaproteobacteria bacterium]|nr:zinc-dependent metalloprotease [Betaproteobacteria bacterium]
MSSFSLTQFTVKTLTASVLLALTANTFAQAPAAPAGNGAAAAPAATQPGAPRPFKDVIKDAKEMPGLFTLYQKDEKVWIEITPEQFDKPFFLNINRTRGLGERFIYSNWMLRGHIVEFHKIGNLVQVIAKNHRYFAKENTPMALTVKESFTDSLLASTNTASAPHPDRKSVLIEANTLLLSDIPGTSTQLEATFRLPYAFDARNSSFLDAQTSPDATNLHVNAHYAVPKLPAPPLVPSPGPQVPPPATLEDDRSLFLGIYYSFSKLPETPMPYRKADDRVGHFVLQHWDYTDDYAAFPRNFIIKRWRLDKKDPDAAQSEPIKPIVYWMNRNIPDKYRASVKAGILEWNKAFEKIGFKNAIRVEMQGDNANFNINDGQHASVSWYADINDGALAIGPSRSDPRTGEILDADIAVSDGWTRLPRRRAVEQTPSVAAAHTHLMDGDHAQCAYGNHAMDDLSFALDLLAARGDIDPDSPEAEAIVQATLKDVVTHEVGHTLGLQHNFRASTIYSLEQTDNAEFTRKNGLTGSVMDYNAVNIAPKGKKQGEYVMSTLGPYDYWAIEYAYKPIKPGQEKEELNRIASRSNEPLLAFGNDIDAGVGNITGSDPEVNQRDLGSDPLEYAARRFTLSRELWDRLQNKQMKPGESRDILRRNFISSNAQIAVAANVASKYIGGVVQVRDHEGSPRANFTPVPAVKQRAALKLLTDGLFKSDSFKFKAEFLARLAPDHFYDRYFTDGTGLANVVNPDINLAAVVLSLQRPVLEQLLSDAVVSRILNANARAAGDKATLTLSEHYDTVQNAIWSELRTGGDIDQMRRNLQREHLKVLVRNILQPSTTTPADARSLQRENAVQLVAQMRSAQAKPMSKEAKAHLAESINTLSEALKAPMQKVGV